MKLFHNRTILALALTILAVVFPCAAWYLVGSREAGHQVADLTRNADQNAHDTAIRLAQQLSQRLGALLEAEARRPFYHYQQYFHDPQGAAEGSSVVPSPLATGSSDPLIQIYFQVNGDSGRVTLPTAEAELAEYQVPQARRARSDELLFLRRQLERGIASILAAVRGESRQVAQVKGGQNPSQQFAKQADAPPAQQLEYGRKVEVLDRSAWAQNQVASELYKDIKSGSNVARENAANAPTKEDKEEANVRIFIGPMKWRTVYVENQPSLVALREVTTPQGSLLQGFLVSTSGLADFFRTAGMPARIQPGQASGTFEGQINIAEEPWRVIVDPATALAAVTRQATDLRRSFLAIFLGGVAIALIAGLGVVWIVWQTEQLARQRSQFAASAAHELRTPLAGLRLYSDMLAEGLGDAGKTRTYAQRVADEAERLGRVVANVLGFTRLERGRLNVQPAKGDLADVVRESVARQQPAIEAAGARLDVAIAESLPTVKFDRDAMAQIVQNLLDNAEKHTRHATDRTIHLSLASGNGAVELIIADHGPGVPAEVRRHLFEAFARGNQNDAPAGLGLGLVLVKALTEAQGAQVSYSDNHGGGAKFVVRFAV